MEAAGGQPTLAPQSAAEAAAMLARASADGRSLRFRGAGTKLAWVAHPGVDGPRKWSWLDTSRLDRVTVAEGGTMATLAAGTSMARAQSILARSGLMLAIDPQLGLGSSPAATIGGIVAADDSGPLSHCYGSLSDQIAGVTLATPDGKQLHSGPLSRADPPGYDLGRLVVGSYGTLGLILSVDVHLRTLPKATSSATATAEDPHLLLHAAQEISARHGDVQALDIAWRGGRGALLVQAAGELAGATAGKVAVTMRELGVGQVSVVGQDGMLWARQRAAQRSLSHAVLRVLTPADTMPQIVTLADRVAATVVGRAVLGVYYMTLEPGQIGAVRAGLPSGASAVVLDLPAAAGPAVDRFGLTRASAVQAARRLKSRFDPLGVCNPGVFVGGI